MSNVIKREESLYGVTYWAYWNPHAKPRLQVYRYVGRNYDTGLYYFEHRRCRGSIMARSYRQLVEACFWPFCISNGPLHVELQRLMFPETAFYP